MPALIEFDSLPDTYKEKYILKHGDPHKKEEDNMCSQELVLDEKAKEFYSEKYTYMKNGIDTHLEPEFVKEYSINATIIEKVIKTLNDRRAMTAKLNNCRRDLWSTITVEYENWRQLYGHSLPKSINRLKDKIREFKKDGYAALVSGKLGNTSTQKIGEKEGKLLISLRRSSDPIYTEQQIFDEFNRQADKRGFKPIKSITTIHFYLNHPEIKQLWEDAAYGEMRLNQAVGRKESTRLPSMRDALWYGDGTKLNLYYKEISHTGKVSVRTTSVYEVIDAYSEALLGYHISDTENFSQQYQALRMAVTVSGHRPFEIVNDNQGSQNKLKTKEFFENICRVHRATAPYRGQAKTIENIFGRFQQQVLHQLYNFTGQNITATSQKSRPNLERIQANKDSLPTLAELRGIYAEARKEWNEMKHPTAGISRIEMYAASVNEQSPVVTDFEMINMFWFMTEKPSKFMSDGIEIQVNNQKYQYEVFSKPGVPDLEWRRYHTFEKFYIQYDPADMSHVRLYSIDRAGGKHYCCTAEPYIVIHRAIQEQTSEEKAFLKMMTGLEKKERINRNVEARSIAREYGTDYTQQGLVAPPLKGLSKKENDEIERRLNDVRKPDAAIEIGKYAKEVSNLTIDEVSEIKLNDDKEIDEKVKYAFGL